MASPGRDFRTVNRLCHVRHGHLYARIVSRKGILFGLDGSHPTSSSFMVEIYRISLDSCTLVRWVRQAAPIILGESMLSTLIISVPSHLPMSTSRVQYVIYIYHLGPRNKEVYGLQRLTVRHRPVIILLTVLPQGHNGRQHAQDKNRFDRVIRVEVVSAPFLPCSFLLPLLPSP